MQTLFNRKPITKRKTPRSKAKTNLRSKIRLGVFERSGGRCELKLRDDCIPGVLPFTSRTGTPFDHGHLVHRLGEGAGGKTDMENCCWGCWKCHLLGLHRGEYGAANKPVPAKTLPSAVEARDWTTDYYGN